MKRIKKIVLYVFATLLVALLIVVIISPYKKHSNDYRTVEATIDISAPIDSVFKYMGNSAYASEWSSYVDHITPINSEEFQDGTVNSVRRIFINKNEKGARWDEKMLKVKQNELRTLSIFNIQEMTLSADGLQTEQRYKKVNSNSTRLSLVLYFDTENDSYWNQLWMHVSSFKVRKIFQKNLENIKIEIESRSKR